MGRIQAFRYDGHACWISMYRTQRNTPVGTVWRFISPQNNTILVVPYEMPGTSPGEPHCIPDEVKSVCAFSELGEELCRAAFALENDERLRILTDAGAKYGLPKLREQADYLEKVGSISDKECQTIGKSLFWSLINQIQSVHKTNLIELIYKTLPNKISRVIDFAVEHQGKTTKKQKENARRDVMIEAPFIATFRGAANPVLVKEVRSVGHDAADIEALTLEKMSQDLGKPTTKSSINDFTSKILSSPKTLMTPNDMEELFRSAPIQPTAEHKPNLAEDSSSSSPDLYKGLPYMKPADVYEILDINRYKLKKLLKEGILKLYTLRQSDTKSNGKTKMRLINAAEVLCLAKRSPKVEPKVKPSKNST